MEEQDFSSSLLDLQARMSELDMDKKKLEEETGHDLWLYTVEGMALRCFVPHSVSGA